MNTYKKLCDVSPSLLSNLVCVCADGKSSIPYSFRLDPLWCSCGDWTWNRLNFLMHPLTQYPTLLALDIAPDYTSSTATIRPKLGSLTADSKEPRAQTLFKLSPNDANISYERLPSVQQSSIFRNALTAVQHMFRIPQAFWCETGP